MTATGTTTQQPAVGYCPVTLNLNGKTYVCEHRLCGHQPDRHRFVARRSTL